MSKDGYEQELTRVQSKRNLFKFIKSYMTKEVNFVAHPEEYWWKRGTQIKRRSIEENFQHLLLDVEKAPEQQEDFAYEGIFDKKPRNQSPTKMKGSRMDVSNFIGTLNRSNFFEDKNLRNNVSHVLALNEEPSNQSFSPNSANSFAPGKKKRNPTSKT